MWIGRNTCVKACDSRSMHVWWTVMWWSRSMIYFFDCLPYKWQSGMSDGISLPIYPPRGMRISTLLWCLISNKYASFFMTNVESMDYIHSHPSIIASLFGTVHCPFSPWELVKTSPVHPNPVIWYALSHINLLISSSKQPPYLRIMAFP